MHMIIQKYEKINIISLGYIFIIISGNYTYIVNITL